MRKFTTTLLLASTLVAGAMAAPSLYAQSSQERSGAMMDHGMMGDQNTKNKGGMMGMMKQMSEMMECAVHAGQGGLNAGRAICRKLSSQIVEE